MKGKKAIALLLPFIVFLFSIRAFAQTKTTGRIVGTVIDETGGGVSRAEITVFNRAIAIKVKASSDESGNYTVGLLPPGIYQVSFAANGFKTLIQEDVSVSITETKVVDAELVAGGIEESVAIHASPSSLIQSDGPQQGRVIDSRMVSELPLGTRNFTQILGLSPGASVDLPDNTAVGRNSLDISVNGARATQNNYQINGVDANNIVSNNSARLAVPAPETIQEFKVQTSLYDATFGRSGGGNIQVVTKSGSNDLHGSLYEYFRNDALNANNPFSKPRA